MPGNTFLGDVRMGATGDGGSSVVHYEHGRTKPRGLRLLEETSSSPDDRLLSVLEVLKSNHSSERQSINHFQGGNGPVHGKTPRALVRLLPPRTFLKHRTASLILV